MTPGAYGEDRDDYEENVELVAVWIFIRYTLKTVTAVLGLCLTVALSPVALVALTTPALATPGTPRLAATAALLCVSGRALKFGRLVHEKWPERNKIEEAPPKQLDRRKLLADIPVSMFLNAPSALGAELGLARLGAHEWRWGLVAVLWSAPLLLVILGRRATQRVSAIAKFMDGPRGGPEA
jgi:hypothetical protein